MGDHYELPPWCMEAKHILLDRRMTVKALGEAIGCSRELASAVINGRVRNAKIRDRICEHLGIKAS